MRQDITNERLLNNTATTSVGSLGNIDILNEQRHVSVIRDVKGTPVNQTDLDTGARNFLCIMESSISRT